MLAELRTCEKLGVAGAVVPWTIQIRNRHPVAPSRVRVRKHVLQVSREADAMAGAHRLSFLAFQASILTVWCVRLPCTSVHSPLKLPLVVHGQWSTREPHSRCAALVAQVGGFEAKAEYKPYYGEFFENITHDGPSKGFYTRDVTIREQFDPHRCRSLGSVQGGGVLGQPTHHRQIGVSPARA